MMDFAAAASWLRYHSDMQACRDRASEILDYLDFKMIAENLIYCEPSVQSDDNENESDPPPEKRTKVVSLPPLKMMQSWAKHLPEMGVTKEKIKKMQDARL